jgi:hypothetical protein
MKKARTGIVMLGIVLLILPLALRFFAGHPLPEGNEGYGHLRMASFIAQHGIPSVDPAMPERAYSANAFDLLLAVIVKITNTSFAAIVVPFLLGMAALLCLLRLTSALRIPHLVALGTQIAFVLSPFFIDAFTQPVARGLELVLLVLLLLLLAESARAPERATRKFLLALCATLAALVLATFGLIPALTSVALPLLFRTVVRRMPLHMIWASVAAFVMLVAVAIPAFLITEQPVFARPVPVVQAVSDFGSSAGGLSSFAWLLAFIGLALLWHLKRQYYAAMIFTTASLAAALVLPSGLVVSHVLVSFLSGIALAFFASRQWSFADIRMLTLLVLICGLLFSTLAHTVDLAKGPPHADVQRAAAALQDKLPDTAIILSHPHNGFWLAWWSGKEVYLDDWLAQTPHVNDRWSVAEAIWYAQDITQARSLLYKNKIDALVITQEMREGLVWDRPEQGLLFLLRNNETFKNIYRSDSVDIWAIEPSRGTP